MLFTITNTHSPATDLGYLLHKSPFRIHSFEQVFGKAHVFYPETTPERCTAALLLEIDPIGLVRNRRGPSGEAHALEQGQADWSKAAPPPETCLGGENAAPTIETLQGSRAV